MITGIAIEGADLDVGDFNKIIATTTPLEKVILSTLLITRGAKAPIDVYNDVTERIYQNFVSNIDVFNRVANVCAIYYRLEGLYSRWIDESLMLPEMKAPKDRDTEINPQEELFEKLQVDVFGPIGTETIVQKRLIMVNAYKRYTKKRRSRVLPSLNLILSSLQEMNAVSLLKLRQEGKQKLFFLNPDARVVMEKIRDRILKEMNKDPFIKLQQEELVILGLDNQILDARASESDRAIDLLGNGVKRPESDKHMSLEEHKKAVLDYYIASRDFNFKFIFEKFEPRVFKHFIKHIDRDQRYITYKFIRELVGLLIPINNECKEIIEAMIDQNLNSVE